MMKALLYVLLLLAALLSCEISIYSYGVDTKRISRNNNDTSSSLIDLFALSVPPDDDLADANQETVAIKYAFMDRKIMMMNNSIQTREDLLCVTFITLSTLVPDDSSIPTSCENSIANELQ